MVSLNLGSVKIKVVFPPPDDYLAITQGCGLFDRSERGKLALTGADAKTFLQGQVTNDVSALTPGSGCYAAFLTPKGKMLGDLRILDTGEEVLLDTERVALQELFNMIRRFSIGYELELHKRTLERSLLSLIGPESGSVLTAVTGEGRKPALGPREHDNAPVILGGDGEQIPALAVRTDVGVDLLYEADAGPAVGAALLAAGAVTVGEEATECLRLERGRPRYGVDLDDTVIPQEAGLNERAVSFTKGCYVGQETVARLFYRGKPNRRLCGLHASGPVVPGMQITYEDRAVGKVTSAAESPRFGAIALALVRREAPDGAFVALSASVGAEIVTLPFG